MKRKESKYPPKLAKLFLKKIVSRDIKYSAVGDFDEIFYDLAEQKGYFNALLWY